MAIDLSTGVHVAVEHSSGDGRLIPVCIDRLILRSNGSVFADVTETLTGRTGRLRWDGHQRVRVLPEHYGICGKCGAIAPCPQEQIARTADRLRIESDPLVRLERELRSR